MEYEFAGPSVLPEEMADHSFDGPISFDVDGLCALQIFEDLVEESSAVRGWLGVKRLVLADDAAHDRTAICYARVLAL